MRDLVASWKAAHQVVVFTNGCFDLLHAGHARYLQDARALGITTIWLTVNRHNTIATAAYEKMGFEKQGTLLTYIGNGFVMDDFKMVMSIG